MNVTVLNVARDEGSVVVFNAVNDNGEIRFACDHRSAQDIVNALDAGEDVDVDIEDWQIL